MSIARCSVADVPRRAERNGSAGENVLDFDESGAHDALKCGNDLGEKSEQWVQEKNPYPSKSPFGAIGAALPTGASAKPVIERRTQGRCHIEQGDQRQGKGRESVPTIAL